MRNVIFCLIFAISFCFSSYSAQCPSWSLNTTWQQWDCASYDNVNYYAAGPTGIEYLPTQIYTLSAKSNTNTVEPFDTWDGWINCSDLPDSARISICEKQFVYCTDGSSGYLSHDTVYIYDTITVPVTKYDTTIIKITQYDTSLVSIFDTTRYSIDIFDTTHFEFAIYDTTTYNIDKYDTLVTMIDVYDTIITKVDLKDTNFIIIRDTSFIKDTVKDIVRMTITLYDTVHETVIDTSRVMFLDTLRKTFDDTLELNFNIKKISYVIQYDLNHTPYFVASLDSLDYEFNDSSIVRIQWNFYIYDNLGQFISDSKGDTVLYHAGSFTNLKSAIFKQNSLGQYIASNNRLLGDGVYIIKGSCILFLDGKYQYRQFITTPYGYSRLN